MGVISFRVYIIIAITLFGLLFAVQLLGGSAGVANFFITVRAQAAGGGMSYTIANFIIGPIIWTFETQYYGPIVAGLAWPIAIVWLLLFIIVWMYSLLAPGFSDIPG
jgi:hypothetical protein